MDNENKELEINLDNIITDRDALEAELDKISILDQDDKLYKLGEAAKMLKKSVPTLRLYVDEFADYLGDELHKLDSGHRMLTKKGILMLDKIFLEKENGNYTNEEIKQLLKETDGIAFAPTPSEAFSVAYKKVLAMVEEQLKQGIKDYSSTLIENVNQEQKEKYEELEKKLDILMQQNQELQELLKEKENKGFLKNLFSKK